MTGFFTKNLGWKLASLGVGVLLWISVASEPELAAFASVPVQYKDLPDDLEISSGLVESVYLELRGPATELRSFAESKRAAVVLDLSRVHSGEQTFTLGDGNIKLPRGIRTVRAIPAQLRFTFERRAAVSVPVKVRFASGFPQGYEMASAEVTPPSLTIVGPERRVARIKAAMTDPIDLSSVVGTAEFRVNAFVDDPQVRFQSPPQVTVRVTMKRK